MAYVAYRAVSIAVNEYYVGLQLPQPMLRTPTVTAYPYTTPGDTGRSSDGAGTDFAAGSATPASLTPTIIALQNASIGVLVMNANGLIHVGLLASAEL